MPVKTHDIATFTRQLANLSQGGLNLSKSLDLATQQTKNKEFKRILLNVKQNIHHGQSFSEALQNQKNTFPPLYIGLLQSGEANGELDASLLELADMLEHQMDISRRIRSALTYPAFLLIFSLLVCVFLTLVVIPRFELLFNDLGQSLPWPTQLLISLTTIFKNPLSWFIPLPLFFLRKKIKNLFFKTPGLTEVIDGFNLEKWCRAMASLLRGGLTLTDALAISARSFGKNKIGQALPKVTADVLEGRSLSTAFQSAGVFPPLVTELIAAAEETDSLSDTFERLAHIQNKEIEHKIKLMLSFLEPALVIGVGVLVGFVALAMLLPVFDMSAQLKG